MSLRADEPRVVQLHESTQSADSPAATRSRARSVESALRVSTHFHTASSQALNALVFLYQTVLERSLGEMQNLKRVQRKHRIPVVLSPGEVASVLSRMSGTPKLMAEIMYGSGLRVHECVTLRVKDIDFIARTITVRSGKGNKDRTTVLPQALVSLLQQHMIRVADLHRSDLLNGSGFAPLPDALARKYPRAAQSLAWQYVFPSSVQRPHPDSRRLIRWHASDSTVQRAFKQALMASHVHKHGSVHTLRHSFATHLLARGGRHSDNSTATWASEP
jgi:site-specific recombinase XerD